LYGGRQKSTTLAGNDTNISLVKEYCHLGHIITADLDDKTELISKRNLLCGKINNVLCYFKNCDPFVKIKLLRHYCYDFYGSNLWNLAHNNIEDICITWRKSLRRIWNLPVCTHCRLLGPICSLLPLKYELNCRSASFIVKSLSSANRTVNFVARNGVFFRRMLSPIGCNAFYCASFYGLSVADLDCIDKHLAWQVVQQLEIAPVSDSLSVIKELLGIKFNSLYMPLLNDDEVMFILDFMCTS